MKLISYKKKMEKKRRRSASSLSSPVLPPETIFEILKDLPAKTLVRFRAVSKLWCSIVDDPVFVDSHRTRSYTRTGGIRILCQYVYGEDLILKIYPTDPQGGSPLPFLALPVGILGYRKDDHHKYTFNPLQSVNGLVCRKNCIWNPSTRESIDLPPIIFDANGKRRFVYQRNLLGFDSVSKQYKVVNMCVFSFGQIRRAEFRILTLGRDLYWRNLDSVPEIFFRTHLGVCCVDDIIFCSSWVDTTIVIVAFEVGPEKFRVIPLPNGAHDRCMNSHIIQVGGRLGFVNVNYATAGEVDVDQLTNVKVVESLDFVEARDVDHATNGDSNDDNDDVMTGLDIGDSDDDDGNEPEWVEVMNTWVLEDYHKQQWKREIFTFPSQRRFKHHGIKMSISTTPIGSIHTSEILLCSEGESQNRCSIYSCSYYDLERKSLRIVPKVTEIPKNYQCPENYDKDLIFVAFAKHVECLFRLKVT